jgi:hypothetical protein
MLGFVGWLAPQIEALPAKLAEIFRAARDRARAEGMHLRTPEALAHLWVGAVVGLQYAVHSGALPAGDVDGYREKVWSALHKVAEDHAEQMRSEEPVRRWLGLLATLFRQRRAFVLPKGDAPGLPRPGTEFIGWVDGDRVLLLPDAAVQVVARFARESGLLCLAGRDALLRGLKRHKLCISDEERTLLSLKIGDHKTRVLCLAIASVGEFTEDDFAQAIETSRRPPEGEERL